MLGIGEETAEAFHQSHTVREFHLPSSPRSSGQRHAEYGVVLFGKSRADDLQTNILKAILVHDITEATSILTSLNGYARREHYRHSA